ncbi:hypothetical protein COX73_00885 [bacterium (Candidatus Gribaldobacteria) CG_4_10_14_0_2_um_filter_36_18]|uniref:Methyltransferase type 11 domain-containing protein n=1 Tax=bacterium (Candidatus Gribaldobacteria) CG_4_10_14_0_2_um_filter_36_18 TaxID=2014264 RepID=A0A2M7VKT9_9BACT|nr:MAG: hypothetical protein COX73_00885 [bacterium (Candidatus Gribaldobacteria) CG_4_10_14_0_2_um_filter_36_18]
MLDSNFWANYFKVYDVLNLLIPYQELLETICDELEIKPGEKILEAGCGTGNLALKIKERGAKVVGLDNCQEALDIYRKKDPTAELVLADLAKKLPFPDNYFDKIASNNTLYAVPREKRDQLMKESLRILKPGGKIVLANMREGWKPINVYIDHIKKDIKIFGLLVVFLKVIKNIIPTIKMFYYNNKALKADKVGTFSFFKFDEQGSLLIKNGFKNVSKNIYVYSGQAILNSAKK